MLKKVINYTDYNGVQREEEFLFNLTKAEIAEMELSVDGGFAEKLKKIIDAKSAPEIIKVFKEIILKAYGVKSDDGKRFIKTQQLRDEFEQTEAYSNLFMELATNADEAGKFINSIIPQDMEKYTNK